MVADDFGMTLVSLDLSGERPTFFRPSSYGVYQIGEV
jgi:hypothetical protein